ncbi:hypothetical protein I7I53_08830 [Histoplasma capsulatum var. duboisii H88]|uniref:Uncharacterized protein n=1 Tax=Ajellomyces capsulatus (strain H88) TaxID=544711 RepID=A0A8A1L484_AJEC8|nr:hypothetical protein I7I53_08830 [Histoplasma capsulatum var. duboisii H88]
MNINPPPPHTVAEWHETRATVFPINCSQTVPSRAGPGRGKEKLCKLRKLQVKFSIPSDPIRSSPIIRTQMTWEVCPILLLQGMMPCHGGGDTDEICAVHVSATRSSFPPATCIWTE